MQALMLEGYQKLRLVSVPEPEIGPTDVLVRVQACGICGSDIHGYDGSTGRRQPPLIMGHEAAGVVAEVGSNVSQFSPGDRITFDSTVSCGECYFCQAGKSNLCDRRMVLGVSCNEYRRDGAFAEYIAVPARICHHLPAVLPFGHAAMIEAVSVALHAVTRTPVQVGDTAVVFGAGMIGLLAVQALRLAGCSRIIAVDRDLGRLEKAKLLGADDGLEYSGILTHDGYDLCREIRERTGGRGADVVLEVVGARATLQVAIECARKGGAVTLVGNLAPKAETPLQTIVTRELNLFGSCASCGEIPACIDLMARGMIRVEELITATCSLEEAADWFSRLYRREPGDLKVIVEPARGL